MSHPDSEDNNEKAADDHREADFLVVYSGLNLIDVKRL